MVPNCVGKVGTLVAVVLVLAGCASLSSPSRPHPEDLHAAATAPLPQRPADGQALVYVVRPSVDCGAFDSSVFVDTQQPDAQMGATQGRQYIYFDLPPGEHKVFSRVDHWDTWADTTVSARAGAVLFLQQEPHMGFITLTNTLVPLPESQGKYHVRTLTKGTIVHDPPPPDAPALAAPVPPPGPGPEPARPATVTGIITGGHYAKGVGFSNLNVKLEVTADTGERAIFYVRSDSRIVDASGKPLEYLVASRGKGKRVEIEYFTITDGTGGDPSRTDFAFEIGEKGVRVLRFLP